MHISVVTIHIIIFEIYVSLACSLVKQACVVLEGSRCKLCFYIWLFLNYEFNTNY